MSISEHLVKSRQLTPTSLNADGDIACPSRSARRRRSETIQAAKLLHGATSDNMTPAYEGLLTALTSLFLFAFWSEIGKLVKSCPRLTDKVISKIVKEQMKCFENSQENFVRSVNTLYKGGIASKQKYNAVRSSLAMCLDETSAGVCRKHINLMKNIPVPRLLTYKNLLKRINEIDIGVLHDVRENLCHGLDEEHKVDGKYRDLLQLMTNMARFYLTANKHRQDKLNWFGKQEGTFKVAIGGDGAPFGKDDQVLAWLVSFLNCEKRVCRSEENFLQIGANCSEDCEPVRRYVTMLKEQMSEIEGKTYNVEGKEITLSLKFELLPNDMKYLAFLGGELSISASYFSPFADVKKADIDNPQGTFGLEHQHKWHPWKYCERIKVAAAVEKKKAELSKTTLKLATKRESHFFHFTAKIQAGVPSTCW